MIETLGAAVGVLFIFSKVVGVVKAILFTKDIVSKVAHDEREDYIVAHVMESHGQSFKWCHEAQCAAI